MHAQHVYPEIQAALAARCNSATGAGILTGVHSLGDALIVEVQDGTEFILNLERLTESGAPSTQIGDPLPIAARLLREPGGRD